MVKRQKEQKRLAVREAFTIDSMEWFYPSITAPLSLLGKPGLSQSLSIMENKPPEMHQFGQLSQVTKDVLL